MTAPLEFRIEPTPNPNSMKVTLNRMVGEDRGKTYSPANAADWPLAQRLFEITGVTSVFVLKDFVTVSKSPASTWDSILPEVERAIGQELTG